MRSASRLGRAGCLHQGARRRARGLRQDVLPLRDRAVRLVNHADTVERTPAAMRVNFAAAVRAVARMMDRRRGRAAAVHDVARLAATASRCGCRDWSTTDLAPEDVAARARPRGHPEPHRRGVGLLFRRVRAAAGERQHHRADRGGRKEHVVRLLERARVDLFRRRAVQSRPAAGCDARAGVCRRQGRRSASGRRATVCRRPIRKAHFGPALVAKLAQLGASRQAAPAALMRARGTCHDDPPGMRSTIGPPGSALRISSFGKPVSTFPRYALVSRPAGTEMTLSPTSTAVRPRSPASASCWRRCSCSALNSAVGKWLVAKYPVGEFLLLRSVDDAVLLLIPSSGAPAWRVFVACAAARPAAPARRAVVARDRDVLLGGRLHAARRHHDILSGRPDLRDGAVGAAARASTSAGGAGPRCWSASAAS